MVSHRVGQGPHTHVAHPVHSGADQVEGADADVSHAVGTGLLTVARLLRLEGWGGRNVKRDTAWLCSPGFLVWALGHEDTDCMKTGQTLPSHH